MARLAKIINNERKRKMSEKHLALRKELRRKVRDLNLSEDERFEAQLKLQKLPRNSCENRIRNRCEVTGRPRAFLRK